VLLMLGPPSSPGDVGLLSPPPLFGSLSIFCVERYVAPLLLRPALILEALRAPLPPSVLLTVIRSPFTFCYFLLELPDVRPFPRLWWPRVL